MAFHPTLHYLDSYPWLTQLGINPWTIEVAHYYYPHLPADFFTLAAQDLELSHYLTSVFGEDFNSEHMRQLSQVQFVDDEYLLSYSDELIQNQPDTLYLVDDVYRTTDLIKDWSFNQFKDAQQYKLYLRPTELSEIERHKSFIRGLKGRFESNLKTLRYRSSQGSMLRNLRTDVEQATDQHYRLILQILSYLKFMKRTTWLQIISGIVFFAPVRTIKVYTCNAHFAGLLDLMFGTRVEVYLRDALVCIADNTPEANFRPQLPAEQQVVNWP